jgi:hypothetical protein
VEGFAVPPSARPSALTGLVEQSGEPTVLVVGDPMSIACEGGPSISRLETFPPRLKTAEPDGTYVLMDVRHREEWRYVLSPSES